MTWGGLSNIGYIVPQSYNDKIVQFALFQPPNNLGNTKSQGLEGHARASCDEAFHLPGQSAKLSEHMQKYLAALHRVRL